MVQRYVTAIIDVCHFETQATIARLVPGSLWDGGVFCQVLAMLFKPDVVTDVFTQVKKN
jgi:hypothetical protein